MQFNNIIESVKIDLNEEDRTVFTEASKQCSTV